MPHFVCPHYVQHSGATDPYSAAPQGCPAVEFDRAQDEWVLMFQGAAKITFDDGKTVKLAAGDYLLIERHPGEGAAEPASGAPSVGR